jgi:hypothetical protein
MKVMGFRTRVDDDARPGDKIQHYAVFECGHEKRVGHGDVPTDATCPNGCVEIEPDIADTRRPGRRW